MIDTRTLILALGMGNLVLAVLLAGFARGGLATAGRIWTYARWFQGIGFTLVALRGQIPDFASVPIANAAVIAGFVLEFGASWEFLGLRIWRRILPYVLAALLTLYFFALIFDADLRIRIAIVSAAITISFALATAGFALRWNGKSLLAHTVGVADAILTLVSVFRTGSVIMGGDIGLNGNASVQTITFGLLFLFLLFSGFGFLLMTKEAADSELTRLATLDSLTEILNR